MPIDKKRFATVFLVGNLLLLGVGAGVVMGGVAVAVPTAGVGGFTVTFDELKGQGFQQYATLENNSDCSAYPASVAQIEEGTIEGLNLYKDIESPTGDTVRVLITTDETVQFTGLTQKFTYLNGDLTFDQGQRIEAGAPSSDVEDQLSLSSPAITIEDGRIKAQSQFVESITLKGTVVKTEVNPNESADMPESACAQPA
ncbi:DUF6230 family protein [Halomarina halobia]|uniref:DUF6230 family protein n=1 Tax=Halomarina halobia TaxID=3033386 RepID=A0ABD6A643_9EURY|nr:DUF6230 family protein [Halomarina sp. PSR21]